MSKPSLLHIYHPSLALRQEWFGHVFNIMQVEKKKELPFSTR